MKNGWMLMNIFARFDAFGVSDHNPMLITLGPNERRSGVHFKFKNVLTEDPRYTDLVFLHGDSTLMVALCINSAAGLST